MEGCGGASARLARPHGTPAPLVRCCSLAGLHSHTPPCSEKDDPDQVVQAIVHDHPRSEDHCGHVRPQVGVAPHPMGNQHLALRLAVPVPRLRRVRTFCRRPAIPASLRGLRCDTRPCTVGRRPATALACFSARARRRASPPPAAPHPVAAGPRLTRLQPHVGCAVLRLDAHRRLTVRRRMVVTVAGRGGPSDQSVHPEAPTGGEEEQLVSIVLHMGRVRGGGGARAEGPA